MLSTFIVLLWYNYCVSKIDLLAYTVDATTLLNSFNLDPLYMLIGRTIRPVIFFVSREYKTLFRMFARH